MSDKQRSKNPMDYPEGIRQMKVCCPSCGSTWFRTPNQMPGAMDIKECKYCHTWWRYPKEPEKEHESKKPIRFRDLTVDKIVTVTPIRDKTKQ